MVSIRRRRLLKLCSGRSKVEFAVVRDKVPHLTSMRRLLTILRDHEWFFCYDVLHSNFFAVALFVHPLDEPILIIYEEVSERVCAALNLLILC